MAAGVADQASAKAASLTSKTADTGVRPATRSATARAVPAGVAPATRTGRKPLAASAAGAASLITAVGPGREIPPPPGSTPRGPETLAGGTHPRALTTTRA